MIPSTKFFKTTFVISNPLHDHDLRVIGMTVKLESFMLESFMLESFMLERTFQLNDLDRDLSCIN